VSVALSLGLARLRRRPGQTAAQGLVLALAVALLGAMLLFIGHSLRTMSASATRSVPLDLQGPVASYPKARALAGAVARQPEVAQASPVATAPFAGVSHVGAAGVTDAGAGAILAAPHDYLRHIDTFRFLRGGLRPGEIVLDQQLAATLRARIGDTVRLRLGGGQARAFRVGGVALVTAPDVLFQPLNPLVGPAPAQPRPAAFPRPRRLPAVLRDAERAPSATLRINPVFRRPSAVAERSGPVGRQQSEEGRKASNAAPPPRGARGVRGR